MTRQLICLEPRLQCEIRASRNLIGRKEKILSDTLDAYVTLELSLERFYLKEYLPKVGLKLRGTGTAQSESIQEEEIPDKPPQKSSTRSKEREDSNELKELYRELAKQYHPDLTRGPQDQAFFQTRMMEINEAFEEGDIRKLRHFARRAEAEMGNGGACSLDRLKDLAQQDTILDEMIATYRRKIKSLKKSETFKLMELVRRKALEGVDYLTEMAEAATLGACGSGF